MCCNDAEIRTVFLEMKERDFGGNAGIDDVVSIDRDNRRIIIDFKPLENHFLERVKKAFFAGKDWKTFNIDKFIVKSQILYCDACVEFEGESVSLNYGDVDGPNLTTKMWALIREAFENPNVCGLRGLQKDLKRRAQKFLGSTLSNDDVAENIKSVFNDYFYLLLERTFFLEKIDTYKLTCPEEDSKSEVFFVESFKPSFHWNRWFCGSVVTGNNVTNGVFRIVKKDGILKQSHKEEQNGRCRRLKPERRVTLEDISNITFRDPTPFIRKNCPYFLSPPKVSHREILSDILIISLGKKSDPLMKLIFERAFYNWFMGRKENPRIYFEKRLDALKGCGLSENSVSLLSNKILGVDNLELSNVRSLINNPKVKAKIILLETLCKLCCGGRYNDGGLIGILKKCIADEELTGYKKLPEYILGKGQELVTERNGVFEINLNNCYRFVEELGKSLSGELEAFRKDDDSENSNYRDGLERKIWDSSDSITPEEEASYGEQSTRIREILELILEGELDDVETKLNREGYIDYKLFEDSRFIKSIDEGVINFVQNLINNNNLNGLGNNTETVDFILKLITMVVEIADYDTLENIGNLLTELGNLQVGNERIRGNIERLLSYVVERKREIELAEEELFEREDNLKRLLIIFPLVKVSLIKQVIEGIINNNRNEAEEWKLLYKFGDLNLCSCTLQIGNGISVTDFSFPNDEATSNILYFYLTYPALPWMDMNDYGVIANKFLRKGEKGKKVGITYEKRFYRSFRVIGRKEFHYRGIKVNFE